MTLSPAESQALARFRAGLGELGPRLQSVVLFGSRARGEGHEDSDLDVLVLVRCLTRQDRERVIDLSYDVELASGLALSPLVRDADRWPSGSVLATEIERDGVSV